MLRWHQEDALEWISAAAEAFAREGEVEGELRARFNLHTLRTRVEDWDGAALEAAAVERLVSRLIDQGESLGAVAHGALMTADELLRRGDQLERAYELLALIEPELFSSRGDAELQRRWLLLYGNASLQTGRSVDAREAYLRLLDMPSEPESRGARVAALVNLAFLDYEELVEVPDPATAARARERAEEALREGERAAHFTAVATAAQLVAALTPGPVARKSWERCLDKAQAALPRERRPCLSALARLVAPEDPAAARELLAEATALEVKEDDYMGAVALESERMRVAWDTEPPARARAISRRALGEVERLREEQGDSEMRAGLFSRHSDDYLWYSGRLLVAARDADPRAAADLRAEAFEVAERMRARALRDQVVADGEAARLEPASVAAVRAALAPDEALLAFQVGLREDLRGDFGGGAWVFVVTRDAVRVHELPGRVTVRRKVELIDGLLDPRAGREAEERPVAAVTRELLGPALAELPEEVRRLILVPDDALYRLPFATLSTAPGEPPLASRYELVIAPSSSLWLGWRDAARPSAARPLLAFAAPEVPELPGRLGEVARELLPRALREGAAACRRLGRGSHLAAAAEASEAALHGPNGPALFRILHFAAHAVADERRPERSAILLAAGADGFDGLLQPAEIAALDLDGQLVVLSACRGAGGRVLRGEGMMSLARAFFVAGARAVVASPKPLRDDRAEEIFDLFYRRIAVGDSVAAALAAAQRAQLAAGVPAADWAGLVVLGDGDFVPLPEGASLGARLRRAALPLGSALLALVAIVLAAGRRPRTVR